MSVAPDTVVVRAVDNHRWWLLGAVGSVGVTAWITSVNGILGLFSGLPGLVGLALARTASLKVGPDGIERRGIGTIWWEDIDCVEVQCRLRGVIRTARLRLRQGQRSNLMDTVPLGVFGRGWPENGLGQAVARFCPRLLLARQNGNAGCA